jgi:hypothetical protein
MDILLTSLLLTRYGCSCSRLGDWTDNIIHILSKLDNSISCIRTGTFVCSSCGIVPVTGEIDNRFWTKTLLLSFINHLGGSFLPPTMTSASIRVIESTLSSQYLAAFVGIVLSIDTSISRICLPSTVGVIPYPNLYNIHTK